MYVAYQLGAGIYIYVLRNKKDERNDLVNSIIGSRRYIPTQLGATHLADEKNSTTLRPISSHWDFLEQWEMFFCKLEKSFRKLNCFFVDLNSILQSAQGLPVRQQQGAT